jgi:hypothetical protein
MTKVQFCTLRLYLVEEISQETIIYNCTSESDDGNGGGAIMHSQKNSPKKRPAKR